MACRRASWPTRRSPLSVKATTEGVVREPSAFVITAAPSSQAAITEFVVPRSIPTARAMSHAFRFSWPSAAPGDVVAVVVGDAIATSVVPHARGAVSADLPILASLARHGRKDG